MSARRLRTRRQLTPPASPASVATTRPRRGTVGKAPTTIERSSPDETRTSSIRLTVKTNPAKLKEVTNSNARGQESGKPARAAVMNRKKAVIESEPDDEEDEEEEDDDDEEEAQEDVEEEDVEADSDDEEEGEEDDEDDDAEGSEDEDEEVEEDAEGSEDEAMPDAPPVVPKGKISFVAKPQVTITPAKPSLSVEDKETAMDDGDDEDDDLSELSDDAELEGIEDETEIGAGGDMDDDEDMDEDLSRSATPDPSKLTRRQRQEAAGLMALSNEAQKKKHLTANEVTMRRVEMARRRKALSEKRNDEEKQDTINRLLKRQASKRQRKADIDADRIAEEGEEALEQPNKVFVRYVQTVRGSVMGVPREWVENAYVGGMFGREGEKGGNAAAWSGRMVEVVE